MVLPVPGQVGQTESIQRMFWEDRNREENLQSAYGDILLLDRSDTWQCERQTLADGLGEGVRHYRYVPRSRSVRA